MVRTVPNLNNLFSQLGRPSDDESIRQFIAAYRPLPGAMRLDEAPCWTPAQAAFLCEAIIDDADRAEVVDELNAKLHAEDD